MASKSLGTLTIDLIAKTAGFVEGLTQAERVTKARMREIRSSVEDTGERLKKYTKIVSGLAASTLAIGAVLVNNARQQIDSQVKFARSVDGSIAAIRTLNVAGENSGFEGMEESLNKLTRRLGAVEAGGGPAAATIKRLGIETSLLSKMDADERIAHIADRIRDYGGSAQESARHLQVLGFEQKGALELFRQGGDAIREARSQTEQYGLALSDIDATKIELANDAFTRFNRLREGFATQLTVQMATPLAIVADYIQGIVEDMGGMDEAVADLFDTMVIGSINTVAWMRSSLSPIKDLFQDIWDGYLSLPAWAQEIGIIGAIVAGRKGALVLAGVSKAAADFKVTATWFKAMTEGKVSFSEWFTTGAAGAEERLKQLGISINEIAPEGGEGFSIIKSLFGNSGGDADMTKWADEQITRYRKAAARIQERARTISENSSSSDSSGIVANGIKFSEIEDGLKRQRDLYGETSKAVEMLYDIEHGRYGELDVGQKNALVNLANEIDLKEYLKKEETDADKERKKRMETISQFGVQAARNIQSNFADFLFDPFDKGLGGMLKGFAETLRRMAAEAASAMILKSIFGGFSDSSNSFLAGIGTAFEGLFDGGGTIPGGKIGIVGEIGPEIVRGPAMVTGRQETARILSTGAPTINIHNYGARVQQAYDAGRNSIDIMIDAVNTGLREGRLDESLAAQFGLSRSRGNGGR
jgi:hypothetical protein